MQSQAFEQIHGIQMSMEQFPMEQSLVVSDMDWKHDVYNVITADENAAPFNQPSEQNQAFVAPREAQPLPQLCEQSWGLYFAQKSPAMGTIDGRSRIRPEFSHSSEQPNNRFVPMPQTPPENISFLNQSRSVPPKLSLGGSRRLSNIKANRSYLFGDDMDVDMMNGEQHRNIPQLSIEDLMSPEVKPMECEITRIHHVSDANQWSLNSNGNSPRFDDCIAQLQEAIQNAIKRRRSLEPQIIINQKKSMCPNRSIAQPASQKIVTTEMKDIQQIHRFVQFYIDPEQMLFNESKYIKQECNDLFEYYVSKLREVNSDCVMHHALWLNVNTNQCTFHILMGGNCDIEWAQLFEGMLHRYQWINSTRKKRMFSQLVPQKSV